MSRTIGITKTEKISGSTFLIGLFLLFCGVLYERRAELLKSFSDLHLCVIHMPMYSIVAVIIGIITIFAFVVFMFSKGEERE